MIQYKILADKTGDNKIIKQLEDDIESAGELQIVTLETYHLYVSRFVSYAENILEEFKNDQPQSERCKCAMALATQCHNANNELILFCPLADTE